MQWQVAYDGDFDGYMVNLDLALEQATELGAERVRDLARSFVREDTGSLADTIDIEKIEDVGGGWSVNAGNVEGGYKGGSGMNDKQPGTPVDYAIDQEYGLTGTPFTPYMTPAAEIGWEFVQQVAIAAIERVSG